MKVARSSKGLTGSNVFLGLMLTTLGLLAACSPAEEEPDFDEAALDCSRAVSTLEVGRCMASDLKEAEDTLAQYVQATRDALAQDEATAVAFEQAQTAWVTYREAHCQSVYSLYRDGTIRGAVTLSCKWMMTTDRTYAIWETFLLPEDGSEPVMPEPEFDSIFSNEPPPVE